HVVLEKRVERVRVGRPGGLVPIEVGELRVDLVVLPIPALARSLLHPAGDLATLLGDPGERVLEETGDAVLDGVDPPAAGAAQLLVAGQVGAADRTPQQIADRHHGIRYRSAIRPSKIDAAGGDRAGRPRTSSSQVGVSSATTEGQRRGCAKAGLRPVPGFHASRAARAARAARRARRLVAGSTEPPTAA